MSRIDGLTHDAIARELNIARSTVKEHIMEALVFLRSYMKEEYGIIITGLLWWDLFSS